MMRVFERILFYRNIKTSKISEPVIFFSCIRVLLIPIGPR